MKRREFIAVLSGVLAGWPVTAHAQQLLSPVIGFLHPSSAEAYTSLIPAFRKGLGEVDYVEGRNLTIEYRWADDHYDQLPALAADLVGQRVSVIATANATAAAGNRMNRRAFIAGIGSAPAWPLVAGAQWPPAAVAQTSTKRPLIAWLSLGQQPSSSVYVDAFLQGMQGRGYEEGRNFDIVYRFADGYIERLPALAEEVVRLPPNVILAAATAPAVAAKKVTSTIPIVTPALADAVHLGLIASEARPEGNVTGIAPYVAGLPAKQIELAREVVPGAARIGVLANLSDPKAPPQWQELEAAGQELGVSVVAAEAGTPDDLDAAFQTLASQRVDVIIVLQTSMLVTERRKIAALAATTRMPAIYGYREHVDDGGAGQLRR